MWAWSAIRETYDLCTSSVFPRIKFLILDRVHPNPRGGIGTRISSNSNYDGFTTCELPNPQGSMTWFALSHFWRALTLGAWKNRTIDYYPSIMCGDFYLWFIWLFDLLYCLALITMHCVFSLFLWSCLVLSLGKYVSSVPNYIYDIIIPSFWNVSHYCLFLWLGHSPYGSFMGNFHACFPLTQRLTILALSLLLRV